MPSSYGLEASKVQAVTTRSFAVHQLWLTACIILFEEIIKHIYPGVVLGDY